MKGKRILTALIAAALTGGVTYAYVAPIRENNTVVRWQLQTSTTQTEEMNTEVGMIYGMNTQDKPVKSIPEWRLQVKARMRSGLPTK